MSEVDPAHKLKESITADHAIEVLNRMLKTDHDATALLFLTARAPCSEELAHDPTIQVRSYKIMEDDPEFSVGFLGILNGLFGVDEEGWGPITMVTKAICTEGCVLPDGVKFNVGGPCPICERGGSEETGSIRFGGIEEFKRTDPPEVRRAGSPAP